MPDQDELPPPPAQGLQRLAPIFRYAAMPITAELAVVRQDDRVVYFTGSLPVFEHPVSDEVTFRMFVAQLCAQGSCRQANIVRTFAVPRRSLIRWV